jgi:type 1 fimbria pilin
MRAVLLILIIVVVVLIAGVGSGYININQIRGAEVPSVSATSNGVVAKGGHPPSFDVQTGSVEIGTRNATVKLPEVQVKPPANRGETTSNTANAANAM